MLKARHTGALFGLLLAGTAHAQFAAPVPAVDDAFGPLPVPHFDIGLDGIAEYETNVAHSSAAFARQRGLTRGDFRFRPAVTVDALVPLGRQALTIGGSAGYDFYARNSRLNRERIGLDAALALKFGRCDGAITGNYARRQSDVGDILIVTGDPAIDRRFRNVEDIKRIGATASCGGVVGLRPTVAVSQDWVDNSSDLLRISDYRSTAVSAGIAYTRPSFGTLTLFGTYQTATYPNRPLGLTGGGDGNDGYKLTSGGARFERQIGSRVRGLGEVAYSHVNSDRPDVENFSGITWRGQLAAQVNGRLQAIANVSRAVQPSNRIDANYSIERLYSLDLVHALGPKMQLRGGALQRDRDFRGGGVFLPGLALREDRLRTVSAALTYRLRPRLALSLTAAHDDRDANGTLFDYNSSRIGIGASIGL